jgi:phenylacetate-CoA ligase
MLVMPSGERRWPLLSSRDIARLAKLAPIRQYQFVQKSPQWIELRLVTARPLTTDEETGLAGWVCGRFSHAFTVTFAYFDEIPRTTAGKFEDFVCEVGARPATNR